MEQSSYVYYNTICQFFIRKGNRSGMETMFKDLLFSSAKQGNKKVSSWIKSCIYNSMPFIRLKTKTRRRGKRVIYRVTYLTKEKAEKKALISFSKHMNSQNTNAKRFSTRLSEEIKSLANNKSHPVRLARDNIHKLALKHAPKFWFYKKREKKDNINFINKKKFNKVKKTVKIQRSKLKQQKL